MNPEAFTAIWSDPARLLINIIDILIISYVFYRLLLLIKGTRAEQLLKGLIVLLVFSAVARWMGLSTVTWLIDKLWTGIFIALPIVFQPELRRALEQLGRGGFFPAGAAEPKPETERCIEEVARAAGELSRTSTGALIVWTRETGIRDFLDIGVDLDSKVSQDLLLNIFTPNTPLHDGAIIIERNRIAKAGAFLPLSDNPHLDKRMGTRHRAAAGITEVSDALAVVVSEETGHISLAREGTVKRCRDSEELQAVLKRELVDRYERRQGLWRRKKHED